MADPNPKDLYNQAESEVLTLLQSDTEIAAAFNLFEQRLKDTRSFYDFQIPAISVGAIDSTEKHTQIGLIEVTIQMAARVYSRGGDRDSVTELVQRLTALVGHKLRCEAWNHAPFQGFAEDCELDPVQFQDRLRRSGDSPEYDVEGYLGFQLIVNILRP